MLTNFSSNVPFSPTNDGNRILSDPSIICVNDFTEDSAKLFAVQFNKALSHHQTIIPIVIDSYGGEVFSLISMMDLIKTSQKPVATIVLGKACSCGAVLATCGTDGHRYISPSSKLMIHDVAAGAWGKAKELEARADLGKSLNEMIYSKMAENCKKPKNYFYDIVQSKGRADWYLTPKECKRHNIVQHVKVPVFSTRVEVTYTLA